MAHALCLMQKHQARGGNTKFLTYFKDSFTNLLGLSKGMRAVKLCTNKIPQFLTGGAS